MFLPTTKEELKVRGWDALDIIIVTGDTYIDSPFIGASVIGRYLAKAGFKVGIIAQPDIHTDRDISRLGEPKLFWGITAGATDSIVANYTAIGKKRKNCDFTPGGKNNRRPDRATIVYANLIKRYFKKTKPIVLGGIEASLRRIAHYDFLEDKIRRSILFDAKADVLVYGMGERAVLELAKRIRSNEDFKDIEGICYISKEAPDDYIALPSFEDVKRSKDEFVRMFMIFYEHNKVVSKKGLYQKTGDRYLICNPPAKPLTRAELDEIYEMNFTREVHPYYLRNGKVKAQETIKFSITTHRGCIGECSFCSIPIHQGNIVLSRSQKSIIKEVEKIASLKDFHGYITDVGGPTANMYGIECAKMKDFKKCIKKECLYPKICSHLKISHKSQIDLLKKISIIKGVKKAFVASGIRYDLVMEDSEYGEEYLDSLIADHISGQMKIAPEHTQESVMKYMRKCNVKYLLPFCNRFRALNKRYGKKQYLTFYIIAAHPGCSSADMKKCREFFSKKLHSIPEQVQIFTPTPSTLSTLMYFTGIDPRSGEEIFIEKKIKGKEEQKKIMVHKKRQKLRR
ncbi:MAG: YgiQ family radical SAM protein [Candidatus Schekmanbacteria bacterium]|nr:MAG: YgiQ family radical SAM protein [Candidatus Schekmanbacteria bacterium]